MKQYENKKSYKQYLINLHHEAKNKVLIFSRRKASEMSVYDLKEENYANLNAKPMVLEFVITQLDDNLFMYIQSYKLDLDLVDLLNIIDACNEINFHKLKKLSDDGNRYEEEIRGIKKQADDLEAINENETPNIRLPKLPHETIQLLLLYFKTRARLPQEDINLILHFFRKRKPRSGVESTEKLIAAYNKIGEYYLNQLSLGISHETIASTLTDDDSIYAKEIKNTEYYSPINIEKHTNIFHRDKRCIYRL